MIDLRSWPKRWNDSSLSQLASLPENSRSSPWALFGMFAVGLAAGAAICAYAMSQRSLFRQYGGQTDWNDDQAADPVSVTSHRTNHRPKTKEEVTQK